MKCVLERRKDERAAAAVGTGIGLALLPYELRCVKIELVECTT